MKKQLAECQPREDVVKGLMEELATLGKPTYNQNGTLDWAFFLQCCTLINKYSSIQCKEKVEESVVKRRELLKDDAKKAEYGTTVAKMIAWKKGCKMVITSKVYSTLKVPKTVLTKTVKIYFSDQEKRKEYETTML